MFRWRGKQRLRCAALPFTDAAFVEGLSVWGRDFQVHLYGWPWVHGGRWPTFLGLSKQGRLVAVTGWALIRRADRQEDGHECIRACRVVALGHIRDHKLRQPAEFVRLVDPGGLLVS